MESLRGKGAGDVGWRREAGCSVTGYVNNGRCKAGAKDVAAGAKDVAEWIAENRNFSMTLRAKGGRILGGTAA
jgi:hypothetical protein